MPSAPGRFSDAAEALIVALAREGDDAAFAELVRRRQSWVRHLMRRSCNDMTLADDLAQQVFLQVWRNLHQLRQPSHFGPWLKRIAVNVWLQHSRAHDALRDADEVNEEADGQSRESASNSAAIDLDRGLATLPPAARLCIVLSYHAGMTHREIAELSSMPLGTVKSHISRGTKQLQACLSVYRDELVIEGSK